MCENGRWCTEEGLAQAGRTDQALAVASTIPDDEQKARAMATVASALVEAGDLDQALTIANTIPTDERRAKALTGTIEGLAKAGDLEQATSVARQVLTTADRIRDHGSRAYALATVAGLLVHAEP